jgi:V/A-type H+-transporting ATPase subunit D
MSVNITPTKANLIESKTRLSFSDKSYNLLDKKRTVLIQEIMKLVDEAKSLEAEINETFKDAYLALQQATVSMGLKHLSDYALSIHPEEPFDIITRSIMGVDIPEIVLSDQEETSIPSLPYGFSENNPALDVAIQKFNHVKNVSYKLAETEGRAFRLSMEIKKTQKSANALEKIEIPRLKEVIKQIEESIEEKDREENFRIKKIKNKH